MWAVLALTGLVLGGLLLSLLFCNLTEDPVTESEVADQAEPPVTQEAPEVIPEPLSPDVPVRLKIPRIGVDAPVVPVGLTPDGHMDSPEGPEATGWYELGPRPGEQGSAVIAGHSGYRTGPAVFDDLTQLRPGDRLYVVDDTGASVAFRVRESRQYDPGSRPEEVFLDTGERRLNLVTCTGEWDSAAGTHSKRLVVFADALSPSSNVNRIHSLSRH